MLCPQSVAILLATLDGFLNNGSQQHQCPSDSLYHHHHRSSHVIFPFYSSRLDMTQLNEIHLIICFVTHLLCSAEGICIRFPVSLFAAADALI